MFDVQVATHLKDLVDKARLNEKHVRIARIYKARAASLTSEQTELQERMQRMTEEVERLKSDLKHTISARARAEGIEDEVRSNLSVVEGELREARNVLLVAQNDLAEARISFRRLGTNLLLLGASYGSLKKSYVRLMTNCAIR